MKKIAVLAAMAAGMSMSALAADFTGYLVDQNCASKKEMLGNVQCAQSCVRRGGAVVLATDDGKIYKIGDQEKVKADAGKKVTITGKVENETISVDSVKSM
jgi:hypothetical protein